MRSKLCFFQDPATTIKDLIQMSSQIRSLTPRINLSFCLQDYNIGFLQQVSELIGKKKQYRGEKKKKFDFK